MPYSSALYEVTSLITRVGERRKTTIEALIAVTPEDLTITMRDPRTAERITVHVARDLVPELPEVLERVAR